ncbi:MAG: hypothetical protein ABW127_00090 [Candidatus Thiodiazotropha endolucinida]
MYRKKQQYIVCNIKCLLSVLVFITVLFLSTEREASARSTTYCSALYTDVKQVFLSYEEKTPFSETVNWDKALQLIKRSPTENFLSENNIPYEMATKSMSEILDNNNDVIFIKVLFSYVYKESFSIPLHKNYLASWLEISRNIGGKGDKAEIVTHHTAVNFITVSDTRDNPYRDIASAPHNLLDNVICDVLKFTAKKYCTNKKNFLENELKPINEECVKPDKRYYETKELIQQLEKINNKGE